MSRGSYELEVVGMVRTKDDSWDVTESVGQTAVQVAVGRMVETASESRLFEDHCAQFFVQAAIDSGWTSPFNEETLAEMSATDPMALDRLLAMGDYTAVRTRFFDDFVTEGTRSGLDQTVIVAAGLDARAWRLPGLSASTVYEIDRPEVLEFKQQILDDNRVRPIARCVAVGVDLRYDWPKTLQDKGFDCSRPTTWLVEGLLPYLSATDQDALFEAIDNLSAPGSRIAVEAFGDSFYEPTEPAFPGGVDLVGQAEAIVNGRATTTRQLFYLERHTDVGEWLKQRGWFTEVVAAAAMMDRLGRPVRQDLRDTLIDSMFVQARR